MYTVYIERERKGDPAFLKSSLRCPVFQAADGKDSMYNPLDLGHCQYMVRRENIEQDRGLCSPELPSHQQLQPQNQVPLIQKINGAHRPKVLQLSSKTSK